MFSVIFEVHPHESRKDDYLELAKYLKPKLEKIDGFVDNERFESRRRPGWILSHSTWRDEKSVVRWRSLGEHHEVQQKGRSQIMQDYHLRVGDVVSDTAPPAAAPIHEQRLDETEVGAGKYASFTELTPQDEATFGAQTDLIPAHVGLDLKAGGGIDHDVFASIYNPGKLALLVRWKDASAAKSWKPKPFEGVKALRHRVVRVVREYGMFDRRESPQYYADEKGAETIHAGSAPGRSQ
jgi:heme-degrading monooxygenase HmoA